MVTWLLIMALFYGGCIFAVYRNRKDFSIKHGHLCQFNNKEYAEILFLLFLFVFIIVFWPRQNKFIYFWDYSGYWTKSVEWSKYILSNGFMNNFEMLYQSINNDEYNLFIATIVTIPLSIVGYSFDRYVVVCGIMFLLPVIIVQALITEKMVLILKKQNVIRNKLCNKNCCNTRGQQVIVLSILVSVFITSSYYALFYGYIDVAYLLPMNVIIYLFIDYDMNEISWEKNTFIALLLILIWITRRYTIFFLIGFVFAMMIKACFAISIRKKGAMKTVITNLGYIGVISLGVLCFFFNGFIKRALLNNYGEMYSAYDVEMIQKIFRLVHSYGFITGIIVMIAGVVSFKIKCLFENYIALVVMIVAEVLFFGVVQAMDVHHRMIISAPVFAIVMMLFSCQYSNCFNSSVIKVIGSTCIVLIIINFAKAFASDISSDGCGIIWAEKYKPLVRNDIGELEHMATDLNKLVDNTNDGIYVAASGNILNCDILRKINYPQSLEGVKNLLYTSDVDLRDGFPDGFLTSKYVVTTDPIQLHLTKGQEVVSYLAGIVMDSDSYIGKHFENIGEYRLDQGVVAKIYVKTSEFDEEDLTLLAQHYEDLYPDYDDLFYDRIISIDNE